MKHTMKHMMTSGFIAAAIAGTAHAQPVENIRPPVSPALGTYDTYGDASQTAPEVTRRPRDQDVQGAGTGAGTGQTAPAPDTQRRTWRDDRRTPSGFDLYDSHNPAANSAKWGVGD